MQHLLEKYEHIQKLLKLDRDYPDRREFHKMLSPLLLEMTADKEFMKDIVKRNFSDEGYLKQVWSGYNIPFLYVYENENFYLKVHLFPPEKDGRENVAAHCIHHHNNYIITTNAFFGTGYESFLFEKNPITDPKTLDVDLKITKHFHQKDWNPSMVDSWEPHVVFIPKELSATLIIWSPDKKRTTDTLRQNPLLKSVKAPLRWLIHKVGLTNSFGLAAEKTYQFYPNPNGKGFKGIEEGEYFAPTKADKGPKVDEYSAQMIFAFIQRAGLFDEEFFKEHINIIPSYYHKFIDMCASGEQISDVYHRTVINVPQKTYFREDIEQA